jgi:hypothetical protein
MDDPTVLVILFDIFSHIDRVMRIPNHADTPARLLCRKCPAEVNDQYQACSVSCHTRHAVERHLTTP